MEKTAIQEILRKQREYFQSGATLPASFRVEKLKKLYQTIKAWEGEIAQTLYEDLGKHAFESYMCEIGMALEEIRYLIKRTPRFMKRKKVKTPLAQFPSKSYEQATPYGNVLIMSPWNYPFLLTIDPIADAVAAGNCAVVKPSAYAPATSALLQRLVAECFAPKHVTVVTGGRAENAALLQEKFDFIFFTGSQNVGKEVLRRAAEHLTPAVLELGGKSPCIVDETAKIPLAAKRIVFGKYLNCGQTCVAPDYILCHSSIKEELVKELTLQIKEQYGEKPLENSRYGKIITHKHFDRICSLIDEKGASYGGGRCATNGKIEPTLLANAAWEDKVMQEEIFGPVLPVLTYERLEEVYALLAQKPKPLALYYFTEDKKRAKEVVRRVAFGGGCINDTIIHLATTQMGFGGVGESGMGAYHGKAGFYAFSHVKSIVDKKTWLDIPLRYQPYEEGKREKTLRKFLK